MKIAIVFKSLTGNTELLAKNIKEKLQNEDIIYFGEPKENIDADLFFIGSWTDKGLCCKEISEFCKNLKGKKIGYFGTAGFGGSKEYYNSIFNRSIKNLEDNNTVLDYFFCQGKMPMSTRERYVKMITENPEDAKLKVSIENFDQALSHPDSVDLENVREWAQKLIQDLK